MQKYIQAGHFTELRPYNITKFLEDGGKLTNYIPVLPVHEVRKDKVRVVFDSSAKYSGVSLNDNLITGPDATNLLLGVLLRFRLGSIGFAADVECMFHCFHVSPPHRNLLRFFWWRNNKPGNSYSVYRANVHVFGNKSSPAVATFGLRHAAALFGSKSDQPAQKFIKRDFYVDDAMASTDSAQETIKILSDSRKILSKANIRLHK